MGANPHHSGRVVFLHAGQEMQTDADIRTAILHIERGIIQISSAPSTALAEKSNPHNVIGGPAHTIGPREMVLLHGCFHVIATVLAAFASSNCACRICSPWC